MEGGYDDDPYDPGGPTNQGITLAVYARDRGVEVTADTLAALKAELKAIPSSTVRRIYRNRYWLPASCPDLPPALAFFHFDAAVNQGVAGAARMLQQSVGAEVDAEIGPATLAAAAAQPVLLTLARYGEIRRAHYRSLGHFWRFGKGWLRRVDRTLERALAIDRQQAPDSTPATPAQQQEKTTMATQTEQTESTTSTSTSGEAKWWGQSLTIWGVIITTLSTVLPTFGPLLGLNVTADLVHQIGDQLVQAAQALGGLVGTVMSVYGRVRATTLLERRQITLNM
jgi:lysozyme family protein